MRVVEIFKGSKKDEMYLYVDHNQGLKDVPDALLQSFGTLQSVMVLPLTAERTLARVTATEVLDGIAKDGFFLQMPPPPHSLVESQIAAMVEAEEQLTKGQHQEPMQ